MSKKRPTESSWDSDEELLNDTSGNAITAFPKTSELDLLGDDGELDEDALLGVDETGAKTTTISFANDSLWSMTARQRSKNTISRQEHASHDEQESHVNEQAFVFEETDTADLEDELNVGGQDDDGSGYHVGGRGDYARNVYHQGVSGSAASKLQARNDRRVDYSASGMNASDGGEMGYISHAEQAAYGDDGGAEFGAAAASGDYMGDDTGHETHEDVSGVELEYEQPVEHDDQVHLEYEDSRTVDHDENTKNSAYESESDSDDEGSRHSRGKFTSERTGVISLTPANTREAIPDTLEINDEQAAQIEQFMSDKSQKPKGRGKGRSRPSAHSRLGSQSGTGSHLNPKGHQQNPKGHQQNPKGHQGSRMAPFPRGMLNQNLQLGFPFPGGPQNRGPFPVGLLNPRGQFPLRILNQRGLFSGPQNQRQPFPLGPGSQRGQFPGGPLNMLLGSGLHRGPFPQDRFAGGPNHRGPFPGRPQSSGPQRMSRQNLGNSPQGPQNSRGPPHNQLRPQGSFNQRGAHSQQFGPRPPNMGQLGNRPPGPRNAGPLPLMGQPEGGMRFVRANRPPGNQQEQNIPSLVKPGANIGKSPQGGQQLRPGQMNPLMPQDSRRISPHQRLGPAHGQNRLQSPTGPAQRPKFMPRGPVSGEPAMNPPLLQDNQQPLISGQGDMNAVRKHKIYINPRFQGQQEQAGAPGLGRTVKMGAPIQQKKAKLETDSKSETKQTAPVPATQAGVKRKSTGGEAVAAKVMKEDVVPEDTSTRVVQASSEPSAEDSKKINALLEQQRKQREMIQKKKELARQKQAAIKRKELETKLKEEGKSINDILRAAKTEAPVEQKQAGVIPVKQISGSVAARLGPPPPNQQQSRDPQQQTQHSGPTPAKMRPPQSHGASGPVNSQQPPGAPQNFQARTPAQASSYSNQPKGTGPSPTNRLRGPSSNSDTRYNRVPPSNNNLRGPPPTSDPRFQTPPPSNQFRSSQSDYDKRYLSTQPLQDNNFSVPPPNTDHRIRPPPSIPDHRTRAPPPIADHRLRAGAHQTSHQPNPVPTQSVKYTEPPPALPQAVRFQAPHSAPPQAPAHVQTSQQYQPQYTPANAPPNHPASHYPQPSQSDTSVYSSAPQYTSQATSYQHAAYALPTEHQYQPPTHYPPPSQPYAQSTTSQYQLPPQQQYQPAEAPQYQMPPLQPQYPPPPAQPLYQTPPVQPQYHAPPAQTQYHAPPPQAQYQAPPPQPQYQALSASQYQNSANSYSAPPSDQYYQQMNVGYYAEPQPIQTVTSQVASASGPVGDQRTVQHHTPVGQRIQTIGQRVQPASVAHMRSIIHNVVSQPSHAAETPPAPRQVQSQPAVSRVGTDGQVTVLDGPQKILIQNVPAVATKETLIKICRHFGQVLGVNLMSEQSKAVVQFQKGEQAAKCVAKCNQKCLHKTRLTVKLLPS